VTDRTERETVLRDLLAGIGRADALDDWVERSPLVEVEFIDLPSESRGA
jgi:hypothetical protein